MKRNQRGDFPPCRLLSKSSHFEKLDDYDGNSKANKVIAIRVLQGPEKYKYSD